MKDLLNFNYVPYSSVVEAYFNCRKHKRNKIAAKRYELRYEAYNYWLWKELDNCTYTIDKSICFCVEKPKIREVFAAQFKDRIIHHLLIDRTLDYFEDAFINDTYNCRKEKGVTYGIKRIQEQAKFIGKDCWYLKIDLEGFFMSINKDILWKMTEEFLRNKLKDDPSIEWWIGLFKLVIYNPCEKNCIKQGNLSLWNQLPANKSLFTSNGKGLPIGNLTSQILANFYLTPFDHWLSSQVKGYGRYVDDIILLDTDKSKLLYLLPKIREELKKIDLKLNEKKTICQRADKGIPFIGYKIKPYGVLPGKRLIKNALLLARSINEPLDKHLNRINSYLGFLRYTKCYKIRKKIWEYTLIKFPNENIYTDPNNYYWIKKRKSPAVKVPTTTVSSYKKKPKRKKGKVMKIQNIKPGNIGDEVKVLSELLGLKEREKYDNELFLEVKKYQKAHGLKDDGIVGYNTWSMLLIEDRNKNHYSPKITEYDYTLFSHLLGVYSRALKAVMIVESNNNGFLKSGKPVILFEPHIFYRELRNENINLEPLMSEENKDLLSKTWNKALYKGGETEWDKIERARKISKSAAIKSASWGLFQIMGFNYKSCGCSSLNEFYTKMCIDEFNQFILFINFIKNQNLVKYLQTLNWSEFAKRYNGPGYKQNQYDTRLRDAYLRCV